MPFIRTCFRKCINFFAALGHFLCLFFRQTYEKKLSRFFRIVYFQSTILSQTDYHQFELFSNINKKTPSNDSRWIIYDPMFFRLDYINIKIDLYLQLYLFRTCLSWKLSIQLTCLFMLLSLAVASDMNRVSVLLWQLRQEVFKIPIHFGIF